MRTIYVFAHQDDEFAVAAMLARSARHGDEIFCVYLTDGDTRDVVGRTRDDESIAVLATLGVARARIAFIGTDLSIPDGHLVRHLDSAYDGLFTFVERIGLPDRIYTLAWEGGHQDHDAAHLVVAAVATRLGIASRVRQFPIYHGEGIPAPFFRVLKPLRDLAGVTVEHLGLREAWRNAMLCWSYPSQRRTWLGLFPQAFARLMTTRRLYSAAIDLDRLATRPHAGPLLYERMGRMRYDEFDTYAAPFRARTIIEC
ncbi:MAG: PIG-L family deacetylase [bacterium]|nr:PIG-L family deacetylase [bacterium]